MTDKFRVEIPRHWTKPWPAYFENFYHHCQKIAEQNGWGPMTVINYQLKPLGGRLIITKTQGWYLRWEKESAHTAFVLRWT
jgi:hypothetical protein